MVTVHIEHAISDFGVWRTAFELFATARRDAGVVAERIYRKLDDDEFVIIDLDFATAERAAAFHTFLQTVIWSTPTNSPALASAPRTMILRPVA